MALNSGLQESKLPLSQRSMFVETETTSTAGLRLLLLQVPELWLVGKSTTQTEVLDSRHRRLRISSYMLRPL